MLFASHTHRETFLLSRLLVQSHSHQAPFGLFQSRPEFTKQTPQSEYRSVNPRTDVFLLTVGIETSVYSLNAPVPGQAAALASEIARDLPGARARARGEHTLGVKRLGDRLTYNRLEALVREELAGQTPFDIQITHVDCFPEAPRGTSPVIYLAVESPGLVALHKRLAETFDPVSDEIEGEGYTPHVTVARGGSLETAQRVVEREIEPIEWTVSELIFWNAVRCQQVSSVSLPA